MNKTILVSALLYLITSALLSAQPNSKATLEIKFTGIRNSEGEIAIGLNYSPEGWPRKADRDFKWKKDELKDGEILMKINDLVYGTYAISVLDDENSNWEMDMFLGIPKEGFGFSMNPPFKFRAPRFEECSFLIDEPFKQITISLRYAGKGK